LAWSAPYDNYFRALDDEYLIASRESESPSRCEWLGSRHSLRIGLGSHLVAFYLRRLIGLDNASGHLASFCETSSPATRFAVLSTLGRSLGYCTDLTNEVGERLMAL
jgi:hypothetical protein